MHCALATSSQIVQKKVGGGEEIPEDRKWCAFNNSPFHKEIYWLCLPMSLFKPCQNYHRHVIPQLPPWDSFTVAQEGPSPA